MADSQIYVGSELTLFSRAENWRDYIVAMVKPFLHGCVIEVGAGIGSRTLELHRYAQEWIAIEPDPTMAETLRLAVRAGTLDHRVSVEEGTLRDFSPKFQADIVLYIDVLEHIIDDRSELELAAQTLKTNGRLIIISPAHQWLFSEFDRSIGHHRRYTLAMLERIRPDSLQPEEAWMMDSMGLLASAANRWILHKTMPTFRQIVFWDTYLVPASRKIDPILAHRVGKSIMTVWVKRDAE